MTNFHIQLNNGYFEAKPESIGSSTEEIIAMENRLINQSRIDVIRINLQEAMVALSQCQPEGNA